MTGDRWPRLDGGKAFAVALLAVGAIVVGIQNRPGFYDTVHALLCTQTTCSEPAYATTGWFLAGAPILALAALYRYARPGWPALATMIGCLCWLCAGLATYGLREAEVDDRLRDTHPERILLTPGVVAGLAAFGIGVMLARVIPRVRPAPPAYAEFDRRPPPSRPRRDGDRAQHRLLIVGVCEIVALLVSIGWTAI